MVGKGTTFASDWNAASVTTHDVTHIRWFFDLITEILNVTTAIVFADIGAGQLTKLTVDAALPFEIGMTINVQRRGVRWRNQVH